MRNFYLSIVLLLVNTCFSLLSTGQTSQTVPFQPGTHTWIVPCGVTSITVEAWGAGASGISGTGGGGGGAFASKTLSVTPGTEYTLTVGRGGGTYGGWNANIEGENTTFGGNIVLAEGGGQSGVNRAGGRASASIGDVRFSGGTGGQAGTSGGGSGGGGAAGTSSNGANGIRSTNNSGQQGGAGGNTGGGAGGNGGSLGNGGQKGELPGGGGGERGNWTIFNGDGAGGRILIHYQSEIQNYCIPRFSITEAITRVTFAGIDNSTPNGNGRPNYERFCLTGEVQPGQTYPISLKGDTKGNFTNYFTVFIDWNQDGIFSNAERYQVGTIKNSTGTDALTLTGSILVPTNAKLGLTTMRVLKNFNVFGNDACGNYSYGQAEDYIINVSTPCVNSVAATTASASQINVCAGTQISLSKTGGTLGTDAEWVWREGSANGPIVGKSTAANAQIMITPTATTTYYVAAEGGCSQNSASKSVTVTVAQPAVITLVTGSDDQTVCINTAIAAIAYTGSNIKSPAISGLPAGVTGGMQGSQFVISGTPTVFGTFTYTLTGKNQSSACPDVSVTGRIIVSPAPSNLSYSPASFALCTGNSIGTVTPAFANGTPTHFSITPALPAGLTLDPNTGVLSGTPTAVSANQAYTITASNACGNTTTTVTIEVTGGAKLFSITPSGTTSFCSTNPGVSIGLSGSENGRLYQLYKNGAAIGSTVTGNGGALSFGVQSAGTYSVMATNGTCTVWMNGQAILSQTSNPTTTFTYATEQYCAYGFTDAPVLSGAPATGMFSSATGLVIDPATGVINLSASNPGDYDVKYTIASGGGCAEYFYKKKITIRATPLIFDVYGGGGYCAGSEGSVIGLEMSQPGVNYQLYRGNTTVGSALAGNGGDLEFGTFTTPGTYTVKAKNTGANACEITMNGEAVISLVAPPANFILTASNDTVCQNNVVSLTATAGSNSSLQSVTIPSGALGLSIPNNSLAGIHSLLRIANIPENATIEGVSVKLNISHTKVEDLVINLKGPNGNVLNLFNNLAPKGNWPPRSNFSNTTFSSSSANLLTSSNPPYTGTFTPQKEMGVIGANIISNNESNVETFQGLYGLTGFSANGDWILTVMDNKFQNSGTLTNWEITIQYKVLQDPVSVKWTPATDLYLDAAATIPYLPYQTASVVYAKPKTAGNFQYTAIASNEAGCTVSKSHTISITPAPSLQVVANYCDFPGKIRITANSDMAIQNWLWTGDVTPVNAQSSSYIEPNSAGKFTVSAKAANGCQVSGAMSVAQELVFNGDFSLGNEGFSSGYTYAPGPYIENNNNSGLYPEKTYNIYHDAQYTHKNFWGKDHTKGSGLEGDNFMIVNGAANVIVWEQTVTVLPNTDYYFSAYAMNLNNDGKYAKLRFEVNGVQAGTTADLNTAPKPSNASEVSPANWIRFYSDNVWKSGNATTAVIRIINLQTANGGNDFGLDDISFGTLSTFLSLKSSPNTDNQVGICGDQDIVDISYEIGGNGEHPVLTNLPAGLSTSWDGRELKISGTPTAFGDFNYAITSTGCNPKTKVGKIYVDEPTKPGNFAAPIISTCYNTGAQLTLSNHVGNISGWQKSTNNGLTWTNVAANGSTVNLSNVTSAALYKAVVKNKNCAAAETPVVKVGVRNLWSGDLSTDWMAKKNWSDESLPSTLLCDDVIIPQVTTGNYPVLNSGTTAVKNLKILPNASLTLKEGILSVAGAISNQGTLDATQGTIEFNGTTTQNLSGAIFKNKTLKNLTVSNNSLLQINSTLNDTLNITGTLSFGTAHAKLHTGDNITLKSNAQGTAGVGVVGNENRVNGKFIVERFINTGTNQNPDAHRKSWQLLSTPTQGGTIKDSWQEGAVSDGKLPMQKPTVGYGTLLTTAHKNVPANGYDFYTSPGPSIKTWNNEKSSYDQGPASTEVLLYNPHGYMVLVRGDRTVYTSAALATPTVLRSKGTIITGATTPIVVKKDKFTSIGNPYPSQIDLRKLLFTGGADKIIYVWDPKLSGSYGLGAFQSLYLDNGNYTAIPGGGSYGSGANNFIQSGQAFFVQATSADGTIQFHEGMKETGSKLLLRGGSESKRPAAFIRTNLNGLESGNAFVTDGNLIQFSEEFSNDIDGMDGRKMQNTSENFSIKSQGVQLVIERRKPVTQTDTIFYHMSGVRAQKYQLEIEADHFDSNELEAWLEDGYLQTRTALDLNGTITVDFAVTNIAGSYASDRFRIVFKPASVNAPLPVTFVKVNATAKENNVSVNWTVATEINVLEYIVEKSSDGVRFESAGTVKVNRDAYGKYQYPDMNVGNGVHHYRIRSIDADGKSMLSQTVRVLIDAPESTISVYPNPITNGIVHLHLGNQPKGNYGLRLFNPVGQVIFSKKLDHGGGSHSEKINWDYKMARGLYQLEVTKPGGEKHLIKIKY